MTHSSMSSMAMLPSTGNSYYSSIRPVYGQQPSVSQQSFSLYVLENFYICHCYV